MKTRWLLGAVMVVLLAGYEPDRNSPAGASPSAHPSGQELPAPDPTRDAEWYDY